MNCCDANGECKQGPGCCCRENPVDPVLEIYRTEAKVNWIIFVLGVVTMLGAIIFGMTL